MTGKKRLCRGNGIDRYRIYNLSHRGGRKMKFGKVGKPWSCCGCFERHMNLATAVHFLIYVDFCISWPFNGGGFWLECKWDRDVRWSDGPVTLDTCTHERRQALFCLYCCGERENFAFQNLFSPAFQVSVCPRHVAKSPCPPPRHLLAGNVFCGSLLEDRPR